MADEADGFLHSAFRASNFYEQYKKGFDSYFDPERIFKNDIF